MSLQPPAQTRKLQETLGAKAKGAPGYRFYLLYDKVYREEVLTFAYRRCKANGGAAGVDGQHFEDIERDGVERWLAEEPRKKAYFRRRCGAMDTHRKGQRVDARTSGIGGHAPRALPLP